MPRPSDKPHARIYRRWMDLPAWYTLRNASKALLAELLTRYRPMEPNRFELSQRTVARVAGCARNTAALVLEELEDRGWIASVRVGTGTRGPRASRSPVYMLTAYPSPEGDLATKAFLRWRPDPVQRLKKRPSTAQIRAFDGSLQCQGDMPKFEPLIDATH